MFVNSTAPNFNQQLFKNDPVGFIQSRPAREPLVNKTPAFHEERSHSEDSESSLGMDEEVNHQIENAVEASAKMNPAANIQTELN